MSSILGVETLQHTNGTTALTVSSTGIVTKSKPIIATMHMASAFNNFTEQSWHRTRWDTSDIDTYGNVANVSNQRFDIPVAGYYEIYAQVHMGVTGQGAVVRDTAILISQTPSGGSETVVSSAHTRHHNDSTDSSDATEITHCVIQCAVGDQIIIRHYLNSDTGEPFDVYAKIAEEENAHMYFAGHPVPKATHCWLKKID
jgi:hypothetical protein